MIFSGFLVGTAVFNFSCNTKTEEVTDENADTTVTEQKTPEEVTEAEILQLEADAPSKEMNNNTRSAAGGSEGYNFDDECNQRCEHILGEQGTIFTSSTISREYDECMDQCMKEKAKELAEQQQLQEKEECEKTKQYILEQAQDEFQRCINKAESEEDKEICRDRYRDDKEFYYNYCK